MGRRLAQERAERRREHALRTTLEILRNEGIAIVSLRAVAARADIPLGTLTYYFGSRDDLLRAALELWVAEEIDRVRGLATAIREEGLAPRAAAERCAEILLSYDPDQIAQYELYLSAARTPELRPSVEQAFGAYDRIVAEILRASGAEDAERIAPLFLAFVDGLSLRRVAAPGGAPALAEALGDVFLALSAPRAAGRSAR